ncbi:MAG: siderophore-interacting protein [Actinocatenispora sp.]
MVRTNLRSTRVRPATTELLTLRVLRHEQVSPHFQRVTLGHGDIERFHHMGFDQWFRLFIPTAGDESLARMPRTLTAMSYAKYMTIPKATRPILRNYSVRDYRPDGPEGPELDVDFVLHGSPDDGTAGPATTWATTCRAGDTVAIFNEGIRFNPPPSIRRVLLVADETGLPAWPASSPHCPPTSPATRPSRYPLTPTGRN